MSFKSKGPKIRNVSIVPTLRSELISPAAAIAKTEDEVKSTKSRRKKCLPTLNVFQQYLIDSVKAKKPQMKMQIKREEFKIRPQSWSAIAIWKGSG